VSLISFARNVKRISPLNLLGPPADDSQLVHPGLGDISCALFATRESVLGKQSNQIAGPTEMKPFVYSACGRQALYLTVNFLFLSFFDAPSLIVPCPVATDTCCAQTPRQVVHVVNDMNRDQLFVRDRLQSFRLPSNGHIFLTLGLSSRRLRSFDLNLRNSKLSPDSFCANSADDCSE
jgi:hypothetical protein